MFFRPKNETSKSVKVIEVLILIHFLFYFFDKKYRLCLGGSAGSTVCYPGATLVKITLVKISGEGKRQDEELGE